MYNYLEEMTRDIREYIVDNYTPESYHNHLNSDIAEVLNDELWAEDSITGNGTMGRFFETEEEARQAVFGDFENIDLLIEALEELGSGADSYKKVLKDVHYADSAIRCYLLSTAIYKALEELDA